MRELLGVTGLKANKRVLGPSPDEKISGCSLNGLGIAKCGNTCSIIHCGDGN